MSDPERVEVGARCADDRAVDGQLCIPPTPNPEGRHAWINWMLTPEISIQDLEYHGYNTGMKGVQRGGGSRRPSRTST